MTQPKNTIPDDVIETVEVVPYEGPPPTLFRAAEPAEVVENAARTANILANVIREQGLAVNIADRPYVRVEGYTLLGTMLGVYPVCVWTHKLEDGWEARVEARTRDGAIVGAAEAECLYSEKLWKNRDDYALRSMAQTRATSKALRQPLGFVMTLAGFEATPAEEMPPPPKPRTKKQESDESDEPAIGEPWDSASIIISAAQLRLLWTTIRSRGVPEDQVRRIVQKITGQESTKAIPVYMFETVLEAMETVEAVEVEAQSQFEIPDAARQKGHDDRG